MNAVVRAGFRSLSAMSPALAARAAARIWFRIPAPRVGENARAFLSTGERFTVDVNGRAVAAWRWGTGPTVICVHGWGGHAAQFQSFVHAARQEGLAAVAFDAPSHGQSAPGALGARYTTLFEFADALRVIVGRTRDVAGVIAHSGGCAATGWTLVRAPRLTFPRLAFIAPFARPLPYMKVFQRTLALSDRALQEFQRYTERQFAFQWTELDVPGMADRVDVPPTLVAHDREDRETNWQDGADIAARWPGARLISTTGLGHNRILREPAIVRAVLAFITTAAGNQSGDNSSG